MKLKVKDMDIATGGIFICILNHKDAKALDLHLGDRVLLKYKKKEVTTILDISESDRAVPPGKIGLFEEVLDKLNVKNGNIISIHFTGKPESVNHIRDKLRGKTLRYKELYHIVDDITHDRLTDIEKTYFVAAGFTHGFKDDEIVNLTKAIVNTGEKLKFRGLTLDKHCVGGVPNNRTSMIIVPIITAAGLTMPKTSSRAITSPAGTADTMECLTKVELSQKKIKEIVRKNRGCIVHGGSINLAPADDKIILVEHPLSIDAEGQLLASVMAKKYSVTANYVLIDIPMGPKTKTNTPAKAKHLKRMFEKIGKKLGMNVKVIITDGTQPIGSGIGPLLEAKDVIKILKSEPSAPKDLKKKSLMMAGLLLEMAGKTKNGYKMASEILESGKAWKKMQQIIKSQGRVKIPQLGKYHYHVKSTKSGEVKIVDIEFTAKIARIAGAPLDKGAGLYLYKKVGDKVKRDEELFTIYAENKDKLDLAVELMEENYPFKIK